jgi:hypothetical protein
MRRLLITIDEKREEVLRKAAEDLNVSLSEFIRRLLDEHVVFTGEEPAKLKSTIRRRERE